MSGCPCHILLVEYLLRFHKYGLSCSDTILLLIAPCLTFNLNYNCLGWNKSLQYNIMCSFNAGGVPASVEVIKTIFERHKPLVPKLNLPCVDVRDVATAHVRAMTLPEAAGNRHILTHTNYWLHEIGQILAHEFTPQGYYPTTVGNTWILHQLPSQDI